MKTICVLLSTYNGEKYIEEQLESIVKQENVNVNILVRDDGSKDSTIQILDRWQKEGKLTWYSDENIGPARSFMDLLAHAPKADYYAFCDQDDVWLPSKLSTATSILSTTPQNIPALYFCQWQMVDQNLNEMPTEPMHLLCNFGESLLTNPAAGCTQVFNQALKDAVLSYRPEFLSMHDSWIYRVCLALDGKLYFDKTPYILYRQHGANVIGGTTSLIKRLKRRIKFFFNSTNERLHTAEALYQGYSLSMSQSNAELLNRVVNYRKSFRNTIGLIFRRELRTLKIETNLMFVLAVLTRKF